MQCVGLTAVSLYLLFAGDRHWNGFSVALASPIRQAWEWAILAGLLNIAATVSLYRAFTVGTAALVAPIAAGYPALTILLSLLSGERPLLRSVGIPLVLAGMMLACIPHWNVAVAA